MKRIPGSGTIRYGFLVLLLFVSIFISPLLFFIFAGFSLVAGTLLFLYFKRG